ncbi:hypothetical protein ACIA58_36865 [Kribbella sp. NPDC051586]|uniref:hypothetical protein n=1 Tax=Kribbella sp. NPDC051586 TaxID=3364118 RepID=UPI0037AAE9A5
MFIAATTPDDPLWRIIVDVATAVGTVGAVVVAVWIAVVERGRADKARIAAEQERDALRLDERESQARRIVGWLEDVPGPAFNQSHTVIVVTNGSDLPAFAVSPQAYSPDAAHARVGEYIPVLPPGATVRRDLADLVQGTKTRPYAILDFRDAAGRRWQRDETGGLTLVSENDPPPQIRA